MRMHCTSVLVFPGAPSYSTASCLIVPVDIMDCPVACFPSSCSWHNVHNMLLCWLMRLTYCICLSCCPAVGAPGAGHRPVRGLPCGMRLGHTHRRGLQLPQGGVRDGQPWVSVMADAVCWDCRTDLQQAGSWMYRCCWLVDAWVSHCAGLDCLQEWPLPV